MKIFKKSIALLLLVCCVLPILASCSSKKLGEPLMTLGDITFSENMLEFLLSRYKYYFVSQHTGGKDDKAFWDTKVEGSDKTWNETFTEFVVDNAKTYTAALYLFDDLGLKLPEATVEKIDKEIESLLNGQADGNKNKFNEILATYGVNMDILREVYLMEEKYAMIRDFYYGEYGTEKLSTEAKDAYYKDNYYRFKHIFKYTGSRPVIKDGKFVYDDKGNVRYEEMTKEMDDKVKGTMSALYNAIKDGNEDFDEILEIYNEDIANDEYPNGYYVTETTVYAEEVLDKVFSMDIESYAYVESEYGVHIILRLPLEKGAYDSEENTDFFGNFEDNLIQYTFNKKLEPYKQQIIIDEKLLAKYCLKDVNANPGY